VTKPFDLDELLARVRRLLKRQTDQEHVFGSFSYKWKERALIESGQTVALQSKERLLLEFLLKRPNQIVSREQILDGVWGPDYDGTDRTVDNLIVTLRKKLGSQHLVTERGLGYRFVTMP
jgi:DNA-binding response OmpR family regulator